MRTTRIANPTRRHLTAIFAVLVIITFTASLGAALLSDAGEWSYRLVVLGLIGVALLSAATLMECLASRSEVRGLAVALEEVAATTRRATGLLDSIGETLKSSDETIGYLKSKTADAEMTLEHLLTELKQMRSSTNKSIGVTNRSVMALKVEMESTSGNLFQEFENGAAMHSFANLMAIQKLHRDLSAQIGYPTVDSQMTAQTGVEK